jgi:hypothetical protein
MVRLIVLNPLIFKTTIFKRIFSNIKVTFCYKKIDSKKNNFIQSMAIVNFYADGSIITANLSASLDLSAFVL